MQVFVVGSLGKHVTPVKPYHPPLLFFPLFFLEQTDKRRDVFTHLAIAQAVTAVMVVLPFETLLSLQQLHQYLDMEIIRRQALYTLRRELAEEIDQVAIVFCGLRITKTTLPGISFVNTRQLCCSTLQLAQRQKGF